MSYKPQLPPVTARFPKPSQVAKWRWSELQYYRKDSVAPLKKITNLSFYNESWCGFVGHSPNSVRIMHYDDILNEDKEFGMFLYTSDSEPIKSYQLWYDYKVAGSLRDAKDYSDKRLKVPVPLEEPKKNKLEEFFKENKEDFKVLLTDPIILPIILIWVIILISGILT